MNNPDHYTLRRVDFIVDSDHDPAVSVLIHAPAQVVRAVETASLDLGPEGNHFAGSAGAASMMADQPSARMFSEHQDGEPFPRGRGYSPLIIDCDEVISMGDLWLARRPPDGRRGTQRRGHPGRDRTAASRGPALAADVLRLARRVARGPESHRRDRCTHRRPAGARRGESAQLLPAVLTNCPRRGGQAPGASLPGKPAAGLPWHSQAAGLPAGRYSLVSSSPCPPASRPASPARAEPNR